MFLRSGRGFYTNFQYLRPVSSVPFPSIFRAVSSDPRAACARAAASTHADGHDPFTGPSQTIHKRRPRAPSRPASVAHTAVHTRETRHTDTRVREPTHPPSQALTGHTPALVRFQQGLVRKQAWATAPLPRAPTRAWPAVLPLSLAHACAFLFPSSPAA